MLQLLYLGVNLADNQIDIHSNSISFNDRARIDPLSQVTVSFVANGRLVSISFLTETMRLGSSDLVETRPWRTACRGAGAAEQSQFERN